MSYILALDQGTTSTRAIVFDTDLTPVASAQEEFAQHFPRSGWVEHEADDLWQTSVRTCQAAIRKANVDPGDILSIGITNQRETTLVWNKHTGEVVHRAIVWQDRRTADICKALQDEGHGPLFSRVTGLVLDPYFSATKLKWILDHVEGARTAAANGDLLFGTVDSFLIWKLTEGRRHVTDATNAARTMLYDIHKNRWSDEICALLDLPMGILPEVLDCAADFGVCSSGVLGHPVPIRAVAGDQQAATVGQACFAPGMVKATYGTGCFALLNTGTVAVQSQNHLLTTIAYQLDGTPTYALEGSIFIAGAVVQWLRDGVQLIKTASQTQELAERADPAQDVILVPAFTGLGAPYWAPDCRGAMFGLTRNTGAAEMARAALESVGYQTRDLLDAMKADLGEDATQSVLRVDGGMSASDWSMQFLADIIASPVDRPAVLETTALGVAWLAGMQVGALPGKEEFASTWARECQFIPQMDAHTRENKYSAWSRAVRATLSAV